jgi:hypothetical protein
MVIPDRIRLTGLLQRKPRKRGFLYACDSPATRRARPAAGSTAVSTEPLGAGRAAATTPARSPTPGAQSPFLEMKRGTIEADDADLHEALRVLGLALA